MPPHRPPSCGGGAAQRCAVCDGGAEPRGSRFVSFHFSLGKFLIPPPAAVPAVPPPLGAPPRPHSASAERSAERRPLRAVGGFNSHSRVWIIIIIISFRFFLLFRLLVCFSFCCGFLLLVFWVFVFVFFLSFPSFFLETRALAQQTAALYNSAGPQQWNHH